MWNISIVATDSKVKWGQDIKLIIEYDTKIKEAKVEDIMVLVLR